MPQDYPGGFRSRHRRLCPFSCFWDSRVRVQRGCGLRNTALVTAERRSKGVGDDVPLATSTTVEGANQLNDAPATPVDTGVPVRKTLGRSVPSAS